LGVTFNDQAYSEVLTIRKIVIVGDGACGKTSLLCVFTLGEFPKEYHPTVFDNYVTDCRVDGKSVQLALWDTAGQEEYERLRPLSYSKAHAILIGFAVDTPDTLDNARTKWVEEVNELCPNVPIILVGLKKDLRTDRNAIEDVRKRSSRFVDPQEAENIARQIGARRYLECSALTGEGVDDVFEVATRASLLVSSHSQSSSCCVIL
jgi:Rho family protein